MSRNITIVVIILILVAAVGFLVWFRNQYQAPVSPTMESSAPVVTSNPSPNIEASPTVSPSASASASPKASVKASVSPLPSASVK